MSQTSRAPAAAARILLVLALFVVAADADAKGARRSSSRSSSSSAKAHPTESEGNTVHVRVRDSSDSSGSPSASPEPAPSTGGSQPYRGAARTRPELPQRAADKPYTAEEIARHEAALAAYERDQAQHASSLKTNAEKAEAQRLADEKAAADKAARKAAEASAEGAKAAAALAEQRRAQAAVSADVDRVLQRAKTDYPLLQTPEGEPVLRMILDRQQALAAGGMYPSIAMVEAVADHASMLEPRAKPQAVQVSAPVRTETSPAFGGCYWKTPSVWACR